MPAHRNPTAVVAEPRPAAGATPRLRATDLLPTAADAGLACLRTLALVDAVIDVANVEDRLHTALNASHTDARGGVAARIACAHLATGALTKAYFTLLEARDHKLDTT